MIYIPAISFIPFLAAIGYIDFKTKVIPNKIVYPAAVSAILVNMVFSEISMMHIFAGGMMSFFIAFILRDALHYCSGGDLKLMTLIGLMFGYPWFLPVLLGGFMIGGMMVLALKVGKLQAETAPFGFSLAISAIVVSGWLIFVSVY